MLCQVVFCIGLMKLTIADTDKLGKKKVAAVADQLDPYRDPSLVHFLLFASDGIISNSTLLCIT